MISSPTSDSLQRSDDRDGAGNRGLEVEISAGLFGGLEQCGAVLGQQRFVRGHDRGAMPQGGQDQRPSRLNPADDLDHEIDVLSADQCLGVGGEQRGIDAWAVAVLTAHGDADQLQRPTHPGA